MTSEKRQRPSAPRHIAIIMDGNGRWAKQRGLPRMAGHRAGVENMRRILSACVEKGIRYLTIYAFSTENWSRPSAEVEGLMRIFGEFLDRETRNLHEQGVQIRHLGSMKGVSPTLQRKTQAALDLTRDNTKITLSVAFNYGGRADIVTAVHALLDAGVARDDIDEQAISAHLSTRGLPDPDLIIRTSGESRLSNFLIWQAAYSEYWVTPIFWPDFDSELLQQAIQDYGQRERRFGGLPKNSGSLAQRLLSAALLLPLLIVLVWWSVWSVAATVILATVVSLIELYGAFRQGGYFPRVLVGIASALALILAIGLQATVGYDLLLPVVTLVIVISLVAELAYHQHPGSLPSWGLTLAGAFYIAWLLSHFILLRSLSAPPLHASMFTPLGMQPGVAWIYYACAITWLQDTSAYFVGRQFGRHKLAPILSPKKTWEGAAGGMIGAIITGVVCVLLLGLPITLLQGALLGLVGGIVGPLGDLSESLIKRQVGLKDAGNLIPGHGGILDRADSLLFTIPILYYLIKLFAA